jgi:hypothetical protein
VGGFLNVKSKLDDDVTFVFPIENCLSMTVCKATPLPDGLKLLNSFFHSDQSDREYGDATL